MDTTNPAPLIFIDADQTVTGWSDGAEFMLGWQAGEVVGQPLQSLRLPGEETLPHTRRAGAGPDRLDGRRALAASPRLPCARTRRCVNSWN